MVTLAIFHSTLPAYLNATAGEGDQKSLQVALATDDMKALMQAAEQGQRVDALVADLALLGDDPASTLHTLESALKPELTVVVYAFAKWETVEALRAPKRQVMRAPVSARALRSSMIGLIVKHLTRNPAAAAPQADAGLLRLEQPAPMRRFSDLQLTALQDIKSLVDCECPNQVADLVIALAAFEQYSAQCQNRNEKDAQMHRLLARVTGHARSVMEYGLKELCAFERIDIATLGKARQASG